MTWGQIYDESDQPTNQTGYFPTELRLNHYYISIYVTWMYLVCMYLIPFATLAIFNLLTWLEMRRALARRAHLSTQELKEHNLATMLLVVVLVFFICNLLPLVVNILELVGISNDQLIQVSNLLVTINSSVNILIYCTFGKKFRTVFMQIFFGKQPPCINLTARSMYHHHNHYRGKSNSNQSELLPLKSLPNNRRISDNSCLSHNGTNNTVVHQFAVRIERCDSTTNEENNGDANAILYASDQKSVGVQAKLMKHQEKIIK